MNVLLVRVDGIGDALVCAPLVAALRDGGHRLGALLTTRNAEAFVPDAFAAVHVVERIAWPAHGSTAETYAVALAAARAERYDVALVISEEPEAYRFARESGAATRAGFTNGWEKPLKSLWTRAQLTRPIAREASAWGARVHEVEAVFGLGRALHDEPVPTRELRRLRPLVASGRGGREDVVVLQVAHKVHASAAGALEFRAIAARVAHRYRTVVAASATDADLAKALAAPHRLGVRLYERVGLWREALVRARAIVTPDGGAAHVAGMAGVPCVDIFRAGRSVAYDVRRWRPWAGPSRTLIANVAAEATATAVDAALAALLANAPVLA